MEFFRAVVSPKFGPIFRNNAAKNGLVCVEVTPEVGEQLLRSVEADPAQVITIDVRTKTLSAPGAGVEVAFELDDAVQHRLLEGLDDIGLTLAHADDIARFEAQRPSWMPVTTV